MNSAKKLDILHNDIRSELFTTVHAADNAQIACMSVMISIQRNEMACYEIGKNFNKIRHNPLHYHDYIEIFCLHSFSEKVNITINGCDFDLKGGQMTIIPMLLPHCLNSVCTGSSGLRPMFTLEALKKHVGNEALALFFDWAYLRPWLHGGDVTHLTLEIPKESQFYFDCLINELFDASDHAQSEQLKRGSKLIDEHNAAVAEALHKFSEMFALIFYDSCTEYERKIFEKYRAPMLAVLDYIDEHLAEQIKLSDLCRISGFGVTRFSTVFHEIMKLSPTEYINFTRIRKARFLVVNTDISLSEIGRMCGFNSLDYFGRVFKSHTGCPPKIYRNEYLLEWQE